MGGGKGEGRKGRGKRKEVEEEKRKENKKKKYGRKKMGGGYTGGGRDQNVMRPIKIKVYSELCTVLTSTYLVSCLVNPSL